MHQIMPTKGRIHLTFIGGGTMACAILDGLAESTSTDDYLISITARRSERVAQLSERYPGAYVTDNNDDEKLWRFSSDKQPEAHIVLICTKPHSTFEICDTIRRAYETAPTLCKLPTVVTMCPGITIANVESQLNPQSTSKRFVVVRTMPNTPVSIRQGATALIASRHAAPLDVDHVIALFRAFSPCIETLHDETLLDVAAAVSGSGPAYILQFHQFLVTAGIQQGLPEHVARSLVMQTGVGASMLASKQPEVSLDNMIRNVCVRGGSTEKGIELLVAAGLQTAVASAVSTSLKANRGMTGGELPHIDCLH